MIRLILPIILVAAAIGLFVLYINPTYQGPGGVKALQAQAASYDDALNKSQELKRVRDQLLSKFNTFATQDKERLLAMLPDNVDNIRLVIDINNIASRHSLTVRNLDLGDTEEARTQRSAQAVGGSGSAIGSVNLGFTVTANYDTFLAFLFDLEHSLRLVDIENITFEVSETNINDYGITIRTYWLH